ncbi:MAG: alkaline phosphatase [Clostridiales bacterium]|jgi:alkaline phosphatase|nr:alkaline phosphatase [Clostridiales bacterium]
MKTMVKRFLAGAIALTLILAGSIFVTQGQTVNYADANNSAWTSRAPKYIFLFIGDGMTYPQFTAASDYIGAVNAEGKVVQSEKLTFMDFPVAGNATTFDSTSFAPDSASTATSISTGFKTLSGVINMDESKTVTYETIAEKLKEQLGYEIGIVSSVQINHATPAAFYAHQPSRSNYYEIGQELVDSGFDYFGGGDFISPTGKDGSQKSIYDIAEDAGYTIADTKDEILALTQASDKVIAISPITVGGALPYEVDRQSGDLSLADFTRKGIDTLYNETGFFMMVEGGKIDWACHANDAMSAIQDTIAFDNAVAEAVKFYNKYPNDTLIIVTGDHETGGMSIGFAGTKYSTYLPQLSEQEMSFEAFDTQVASYRENGTSFEAVLSDIEADFGLVTPENASHTPYENLVMTDYEVNLLKDAYTLSMIPKDQRDLSDTDYLTYGGYEPLSMAVTHLINNKSGIGWTSYSHTGLPTAVFARGVGATLFSGAYDNTDIFVKLKSLTNVQ